MLLSLNTIYHLLQLIAENQPQLESVLQSLTYYSTTSDVANQRAAFGVLARLVSLWGGAGAAASRALPGFERFIYETLVALVFEAPAKSTFDLKDAQSQMVRPCAIISRRRLLTQIVTHVTGSERDRWPVQDHVRKARAGAHHVPCNGVSPKHPMSARSI